MIFRKRALPSAKAEFSYFCQTYGEECTRKAQEWTDQLVAAASVNVPIDATISVDELLDTILSVDESVETSGWEHSWQKFKDASVKDKLKAVLAFLRTRKPPWELKVALRCFSCLGGIPVELHAYFEINRVTKEVVFTKFDVYSGS